MFNRPASEPRDAVRSAAPENNFSIDIVLDCSRGLAALWVFLFHIDDLVLSCCPWLHPFAGVGYLGVPVFFVISGYCIFSAAQSVIAGKNTSKRFLQRRLLRIVPPFWISILLLLLLPYLLELISMLKTGHYAAPLPLWRSHGFGDWVAIFLLLKEPFDAVSGQEQGYTLLNSVYWTLAIEVQFYVVVYLALLARQSWKRVLWAVTGVSLVALFSQLAAKGFFLQHWPAFACGIVLRILFMRGWSPARSFGKRELPAALLLGALAMTVFVVLVKNDTAPEFSFFIAAMLSMVILWCAAGVEHGLTSPPRTPEWHRPLSQAIVLPFVLLGQSSYSLYLLHGKLYQLPEMVVRQLVPAGSVIYLLLTVLGTVIGCYGFYLLVERPFMRNGKVKKSRPAVGGIDGLQARG